MPWKADTEAGGILTGGIEAICASIPPVLHLYFIG